jgi:hypothetical protein
MLYLLGIYFIYIILYTIEPQLTMQRKTKTIDMIVVISFIS